MRLLMAIVFFPLFFVLTTEAYGVEDCNGSLCDKYHKAKSHGRVKYLDLVCVNVVQDAPSNVVFMVYDKEGRELDAKDPLHAKPIGRTGKFCVGRHWIKKAHHAVICNDKNHANLSKEGLVILAQQRGMRSTACLKDSCTRK